MTNRRTAVFGSAFNPPHMGHADVINQALGHFSGVILVPSFAHAFGKAMAPFQLRLDMAAALAKHCDWGTNVRVSDIEKSIEAHKPRSEPVYTFDVLEAMEKLWPDTQFVFIVGPDNAKNETWQKFYKASEIDQRWGRWAAEEREQIRSTFIRDALSKGADIPSTMCPATVLDHYTNYLLDNKSV